jgi:hypothetical protein
MVYIHKMLIRHLFVFKSFLTLLRKLFSIPSIPSCFIAFLPFLIFTCFFLLSLFIFALLFDCFPLLVVDLASSTEQVSEHIYHSIGDDSDSPFTGGQGIDPIPVENGPTIPSSPLEGEEIPPYTPYIGSDEFNKIITDPDLKDDAPCRVDDSHKDHDPEEFLADKSNFPEPPVTTSTPSKQGFFSSLFTKVSQFFHSLASNPKSRDGFKDIAKYQDFVTRQNRAIYNEAVRKAHLTGSCYGMNKDRHNLPFDELVKLYSKSPNREIPPTASFAIKKYILSNLLGISSTKKP